MSIKVDEADRYTESEVSDVCTYCARFKDRCAGRSYCIYNGPSITCPHYTEKTTKGDYPQTGEKK